ncbi:MAG: response regulator [Betaproteobacteria bacterium]|nr:response regulator [Betaproteobacteria bacterium]
MNPAQPFSDADVAQLVEAERVAMLYRLVPRTLATAVFFSLVVFFTLRPVTPLPLLVTWLAANNFISVVRLLDVAAYRRAKPAAREARSWHWRFGSLALAAGMTWGMMGTLLFPPDIPQYQAVCTVFLVGIVAVGLFTLNSSWFAFLAMAVPVLLPAALVMPFTGGALGLPFGALIGFFLLVVVSSSRANVRNIEELLTLRFVNAKIALEREAALLAAESAGRARVQFLANMSHEIRTPLNGILGMTQLLREAPADEVQRQRLDAVLASGEHLLGLINDVLDFSKIEAGRLDVDDRPFEPHRAVREVTELLAARAQKRGLTLSTEIADGVPPWVLGDSGRLKQVLNNLIGNAIKFTERGSITVRVGVAQDPSCLRFEVADTGIGIATADQEDLFEPFRQVDASATRTHGGTGLGLAISRQLVQLMGGSIGIDSAPGRGSTFRFTIALTPVQAPCEFAPAESMPGSPLAGRVLLVEDNAVNREIARAMLARGNVTVDCAEDGLEAVEHAAATRFDLILMDCQLPKLDGYQATGQIRKYEKASGSSRVPIIALTANAIRGDRERCLEAGMDDYLSKPFRLDELQEMLRRWLPAAPH